MSTKDNATANLYRQCQKQIATLKNSPSFAMSLGAKELFHTNFLAFVLKDQTQSLDPIRTELRRALGFECLKGELTSCEVWRESNNFDLVIVPILAEDSSLRSRALIIEAKLKSTPTIEQLNSYTHKLASGVSLKIPATTLFPDQDRKIKIYEKSTKNRWEIVKVLLSTEHNLKLDDTGWQSVFWSTISTTLEKSCDEIGRSTLLELLVRDYSDSLKALVAILKESDSYLRKSKNWNVLMSGISEFQEIRLHDLIGKYLASHIVNQLVPEIFGDLHPPKGIHHESFYTNQSPGFSIKQSFKNVKGEQLTVGLQVQGIEIRRFIESPKKNGVKLDAYVKSFAHEWLQSDGFAGLRGDKIKLKVFGVDRFQYTSKNLIDCSWTDLTSELKSGLAKVEKIALENGLICG